MTKVFYVLILLIGVSACGEEATSTGTDSPTGKPTIVVDSVQMKLDSAAKIDALQKQIDSIEKRVY